MLMIQKVEPLQGHWLRLTLTNGDVSFSSSTRHPAWLPRLLPWHGYQRTNCASRPVPFSRPEIVRQNSTASKLRCSPPDPWP